VREMKAQGMRPVDDRPGVGLSASGGWRVNAIGQRRYSEGNAGSPPKIATLGDVGQLT
jgi:hypothetical protein